MTNTMNLTRDTPVVEVPDPNDPQAIGSGGSIAPGRKDAPEQTAAEMTHGEDGHPGQRADGETDKTKSA